MTLRPLVFAILAPLALAQDTPPSPAASPAAALPADAQGLPDGVYARLETNKGVMIGRLFHDKVPFTVANFVGLIEGTIPFKDPQSGQETKRPYYDGLGFHRIIDGFMIQGGCPLGSGMGGPGYSFPDEFSPDLRHAKAGIFSMANAGRHTNGSQFFITLGATPHLDDKHSVFGEVVRGEDVLRAIGKVPVGANDRPNQPVTIVKATVLRVGAAAQAWDPSKRDVPPAAGEADPARVPGADQPVQERVNVKVVCVQWKGVHQAFPHVQRSKDEALELGKKILAHARLKGADMDALARRFSDAPARPYPLVKGKVDAAFEPALRLKPGQVSDALVTPYGVMICEGQ